jgi:predicted transcriptional regulator
MNQLLDRALKAVRQLPENEQDEIARLMLNLARADVPEEQIDAAYLPDVMNGLDQARRGEFATDSEVEAALRRFSA